MQPHWNRVDLFPHSLVQQRHGYESFWLVIHFIERHFECRQRSAANTYQQLSGEIQAPPNAVFARIALYNWNIGTVSTVIFDRVSCQLSTIAMNAVNDDASSGRYAGSTAGGNT